MWVLIALFLTCCELEDIQVDSVQPIIINSLDKVVNKMNCGHYYITRHIAIQLDTVTARSA